MAKEASKSCREETGMPGAALVNTGDPELEYAFYEAERRVLEIQAKLHRWAADDPHRRFDDLFNLVADPGFLLVAWVRVRGNKGAKTAGVDGHTAASIQARGVGDFLGALRDSLKDRSFSPLPSRERLIPKPGTAKRRRLGISTIRDRVVQASLKLVLEPVFEADLLPCSYGFRPGRRVHDAVAEVRFLTSRSYEWIVEGDIKACFDEISHPDLMDRVRARVGDKRVLALVKAFLKAGILTEDGALKDTDTGTPQGSILTPPTQRAISALRSRWVTGVWSGAGERRAAGGAGGVRPGRVPARGGAGCSPGQRAGRRRAGCLGPSGRGVADGAGHPDAGDDRVVDRAGEGCGAVAVSGLAEQSAAICLLLDIICSRFMSCLGIAAPARPSTPSTSTLLPGCWRTGCRRQRLPGRWLCGWAARSGRPGATSPWRRSRGGFPSLMRGRCSLSGFRCGWPPRCGSTPGRPGARSRRLRSRHWRNSCTAGTRTVRADEKAAGRDGARLLPPCGRRNVGGLRHLGAAAAGQDRRPAGGRRRA